MTIIHKNVSDIKKSTGDNPKKILGNYLKITKQFCDSVNSLDVSTVIGKIRLKNENREDT